MTRKDFDAYLEERRNKSTRSFIVLGETYILPPTIPFDALLLFKKLQDRGEDSIVNENDMLEILEAVIGKETTTKIRQELGAEFDIDFMTNILGFALESYNPEAPKTQAGKKAKE